MVVVKIKKAKETIRCVIKRIIKSENYKNCLEATKLKSKMKIKHKRTDKHLLYDKEPYKAKYQVSINKRKSAGLKSVLKLLLNAQMIC